jgi:Common central domain of tyrosinase
LHYWDWTTDPRGSIFGPGFMGSSGGPGGRFPDPNIRFPGSNPTGDVGPPFWDPANGLVFGTPQDRRNPASPVTAAPFPIWRNVKAGAPGAPITAPFNMPSDSTIATTGNNLATDQQYRALSGHQLALINQDLSQVLGLTLAHNIAHGYIGGTVGGDAHFAFLDPFVFLLHSNVDRLWAMWQTTPGQSWRLDPNVVYGVDGSTTKVANRAGFNGFIDGILTELEPWAGNPNNDPSVRKIRPWAPPDNQTEVKNSKHPSVVFPPRYDTNGAIEQEDWRWCSKCQGLAFAGGGPGPCAAGGSHDHTASGQYRLFVNAAGAPGRATGVCAPNARASRLEGFAAGVRQGDNTSSGRTTTRCFATSQAPPVRATGAGAASAED